MIDLTKILKVGDKVYSKIIGEELTVSSIISDQVYAIKCISKKSDFKSVSYFFTKYGQFLDTPNAECLLFPTKDNHSWEHFFKKGELVLVFNSIIHDRRPALYHSKGINNSFKTIVLGSNGEILTEEWKYCIKMPDYVKINLKYYLELDTDLDTDNLL